MGKQKPYGSKMEKFDVVGRSRGTRNLPINIFIMFVSRPSAIYNCVVAGMRRVILENYYGFDFP